MNLRITILLNVTALTFLMSVHHAAAKDIPKQLPDPDTMPLVANKPAKVYILSGQSNMVGIGQVRAGGTRWSGVTDATVSVYEGPWSPKANYDELTPTETKALPVYGGVKPTPFPGGGTQVVRGFIELKTSGVYRFNPGYQASTFNIMALDGIEVYRKEVGESAGIKPAWNWE